jgi:hypothetical protein
MNITIEDTVSIDLINNVTPCGEKRVSTVKLFSQSGNSFSIVFKNEDLETVRKLRAALDLVEDFINK